MSDAESIREWVAREQEHYRQNPIACCRCGRETTDPDLWDPEADTGRVFCDRCWPQRHDDEHHYDN